MKLGRVGVLKLYLVLLLNPALVNDVFESVYYLARLAVAGLNELLLKQLYAVRSCWLYPAVRELLPQPELRVDLRLRH